MNRCLWCGAQSDLRGLFVVDSRAHDFVSEEFYQRTMEAQTVGRTAESLRVSKNYAAKQAAKLENKSYAEEYPRPLESDDALAARVV